MTNDYAENKSIMVPENWTAATIYSLSKKGPFYEEALLPLADEIRRRIGCTRLEKIAESLVEGDKQVRETDSESQIVFPSGKTIST